MGAEKRDAEVKCEVGLDEWIHGIEEHTEVAEIIRNRRFGMMNYSLTLGDF